MNVLPTFASRGELAPLLNKIHHCDALELLRRLPSESVDLILTDFPYNTLQHIEWDKQAVDLKAWWTEAMRVIKPECVIISTASQPFTSQLVMSNPAWFRHEWIWEKSQGTGYLNANRQPMKNHESILVFAKGQHRYYPQMRIGKPYRATSGAVGGFVRDKTVGGYETVNDGERYPLTVLRFNSETGLHPTQKPVDLWSYLMKTYTCTGDIVLDTYSGSGTTAVSAIATKRQFICCDNDVTEGYIEASRKRIASPVQFDLFESASA